MRGAWTIACLTFHEARRRRLLNVIVGMGGLFLLLFGTGLHFIHADVQQNPRASAIGGDRMVVSFVTMAGLYAVNFLIVMASVLVSIETLSGEMASGVMDGLATKPIRRHAIVLGKWLGCWGLMALYVLFLGGGVLAVARLVTGYAPKGVGIGLPLMVLEAGVLLTVAMAAGTRLTGLANGAAAFGLYGVAFVGGWIEQAGTLLGNATARSLGITASLLVPSESLWHLASYYMQHPVMRDLHLTPFSPASVPSPAMVVWAGIHLVLTLALTMALFQRRDL